MNEVMRLEKKYALDQFQASSLRGRLEQVMHPDPHNGARGYLIRSLYFDTPDDQDFMDKVEGLELRRKLRLRIYDPQDSFAMLEMKQKQGPYQKKRSLRLARRDALALCRGDYSPLLQYREPFAGECYGLMHCRCYRPKVVVEYRRQAYIAQENHIRLTLDSGLKTAEACMDLFSKNLARHYAMDPYQAILEVKYNGFLLSYIKDLLNDAHRPEVTISKYCIARRLSMGIRA